MSSTPTMSRRSFIAHASAGAGLALGVSSCSSTSSTAWEYNPDDLNDLVRSYVKIAGTTDRRQIYLQYYGVIIAILPGEMHRPLFRLKGLVRQRWTPEDDNSYTHSNYDHGLFCDWDTGKVMERYNNPFTDEVNEPLHYNSGEITSTIGLSEGHNNPASKDWAVVGNQVSVTQSHVSIFDNPVSPDLFPKASTGEKLRSSWSSTYIADARDLGDPSLPGVDADHIWVYATGFPAWMKVGRKPGYALWKWTGKKFLSKSEIDPYILGEIESRIPGFLTVDKPWPERSDGWTQYSRERKPDPT